MATDAVPVMAEDISRPGPAVRFGDGPTARDPATNVQVAEFDWAISRCCCP